MENINYLCIFCIILHTDIIGLIIFPKPSLSPDFGLSHVASPAHITKLYNVLLLFFSESRLIPEELSNIICNNVMHRRSWVEVIIPNTTILLSNVLKCEPMGYRIVKNTSERVIRGIDHGCYIL